MSLETFEKGEVRVGELVFPYLTNGEGRLMLCLHGFPDSPYSFEHQLRFFGEQGFRVVAPYMRGYALSACPDGPYQTAALAGDVAGLIAALGAKRAVVYGHDWGAPAAYATAVLFPERVERLITAAVPYGNGLASALLTDFAQQKRSWYIFFFQTRLAELALPLSDYGFIDGLWRDWSPGGFPEAALQAAKRTLAEPGVLAAALAYYRTAMGTTPRDPALESDEQRIGSSPITVPTLYFHGADDGCISPNTAGNMGALFTAGFEYCLLENTGHFVHLEEPQRFNERVQKFLENSAD